MKTKISIVLTVCLLFMSMQVNTVTSNAILIDDEQQIDFVVERFFNEFENINGKKTPNQSVKEIATLSASNVKDLYQEKKLSNENDNYLDMVELLLQRKEIIDKASDIDLTEYNKVLNIEKNNICISGNKADIDVKVIKTWNYTFSPKIYSAAEDDFTLNLTKEGTNWKINTIKGLSDVVMDDSIKQMNDKVSSKEKINYIDELCKEYNMDDSASFVSKSKKEAFLSTVSQTAKEASLSTVSQTANAASYSVSAASKYALDHALNPSSSYHYYEGLDCTNFISQCLKAGGIKQHTGTAYSGNCWFYKTSTNRSSSWTGAKEFRNYVTGASSKINMPSSSWEKVDNGDIIQLMRNGSAYHSLIITGVPQTTYGRSDLLVCAHSTNRRHVSLQYYYSGTTKTYYHVKGNK